MSKLTFRAKLNGKLVLTRDLELTDPELMSAIFGCYHECKRKLRYNTKIFRLDVRLINENENYPNSSELKRWQSFHLDVTKDGCLRRHMMTYLKFCVVLETLNILRQYDIQYTLHVFENCSYPYLDKIELCRTITLDRYHKMVKEIEELDPCHPFIRVTCATLYSCLLVICGSKIAVQPYDDHMKGFYEVAVRSSNELAFMSRVSWAIESPEGALRKDFYRRAMQEPDPEKKKKLLCHAPKQKKLEFSIPPATKDCLALGIQVHNTIEILNRHLTHTTKFKDKHLDKIINLFKQMKKLHYSSVESTYKRLQKLKKCIRQFKKQKEHIFPVLTAADLSLLLPTDGSRAESDPIVKQFDAACTRRMKQLKPC